MKTDRITNTIRKPKKQSSVLCDTWNFLVGKGTKPVKVCVHLDMKEMPKQEMVVKQLVMYLSAFEAIRKTGTYNK